VTKSDPAFSHDASVALPDAWVPAGVDELAFLHDACCTTVAGIGSFRDRIIRRHIEANQELSIGAIHLFRRR
jgi:hypothetical protein